MRLFNWRFLVLLAITLALFGGGGFFLGRTGTFSRLTPQKTSELKILVEKDFLLSEKFRRHLEIESGLQLVITQAEDPDSFLEKAPTHDLLWARKDWILATELHLFDFHRTSTVLDFLSQNLSADFFDPEETRASVIPILWTIPVIHLLKKVSAVTAKDLLKLPGKSEWPFWGLNEFIPGFDSALIISDSDLAWKLRPLTSPQAAEDQEADWWFPNEKIRPLVISLAFVENGNLEPDDKIRLLQSWISPADLAGLAAQSQMAITLVGAEERLPPWQRASALRKLGLHHIARP